MSRNYDELLYGEVAKRVIRFQEGDSEAFSEFYDLTKRYVYSTVKGIAPSDADDLVQDVYIKAYTELKNLENPMAAIKWIDTIAYRKAVNSKKVAYKKHELLAPAKEDDSDNETIELSNEDSMSSVILAPEDIMDNQESQRILMDIIDKLPDVQQQVVRGFYFHGIPLQDIASAMGIPVNTVKSHMSRAKKNLRASIEDYSRRYGICLRGIAAIPVLSMLFHKEVEAAVVPETLSTSVLSAVSKIAGDASAIGTQSTASSDKKIAAKTGNADVKSGTAKLFENSKVGGSAAATKYGISKLAIAGMIAGVIAVGGIGAAVFSGHSGQDDKEYIELSENVEIPMTFDEFEEKFDVVDKTDEGEKVIYTLGEEGIKYIGYPSLGGVIEILITEEDTEHSVFGTHIGMTKKEVSSTLKDNSDFAPQIHRKFMTPEGDYMIDYNYSGNNKVNRIDYCWLQNGDPENDNWVMKAESEKTKEEATESANASNDAENKTSAVVKDKNVTSDQSSVSASTINEEQKTTENQVTANQFVPSIFQIQEDVENRVTLGVTEKEDVITYHVNNDGDPSISMSGKINDLDFSIEPGDWLYLFTGAYATDFNTQDGYKNLVVFFTGDSENTEMFIYAYNDSDFLQLTKQYSSMASRYDSGKYGSAFEKVDEQHIPEDGKIILESCTNWSQGDNGAVITREEYRVNGTEISEEKAYIGHYSGQEFVEGYTVILNTDLSIFEDEATTNQIGTIPSGTEVNLEKGRNSVYLSGGGQSGWATYSDIAQAARGEGFSGWS